MVWRYWKRIGVFTWTDTIKTLHLNSLVGFFLWLASTLVVLAGLSFWGSADASRDEFLTRLFLASVALGAIPVVFAWKFIGMPAAIHKDMREWAKELEGVIIELEETDKAVYGVADRYSAGMNLVLGELDEERLRVWEEEFDAFIKQNFDAEYFLQLCSPAYPAISYTVIHNGTNTRTIRNIDNHIDDRARVEAKLHNLKTWMGLAAGHYRGKSFNSLQLMAGEIRRSGLLEHRAPINTA